MRAIRPVFLKSVGGLVFIVLTVQSSFLQQTLALQIKTVPESVTDPAPERQSEFEKQLRNSKRLVRIDYQNLVELNLLGDQLRLIFQVGTMNVGAGSTPIRGVRILYQLKNPFETYITTAEAYLGIEEIPHFQEAVSTIHQQMSGGQQISQGRERLFRYVPSGAILLRATFTSSGTQANLFIQERMLNVRAEELEGLHSALERVKDQLKQP